MMFLRYVPSGRREPGMTRGSSLVVLEGMPREEVAMAKSPSAREGSSAKESKKIREIEPDKKKKKTNQDSKNNRCTHEQSSIN